MDCFFNRNCKFLKSNIGNETNYHVLLHFSVQFQNVALLPLQVCISRSENAKIFGGCACSVTMFQTDSSYFIHFFLLYFIIQLSDYQETSSSIIQKISLVNDCIYFEGEGNKFFIPIQYKFFLFSFYIRHKSGNSIFVFLRQDKSTTLICTMYSTIVYICC